MSPDPIRIDFPGLTPATKVGGRGSGGSSRRRKGLQARIGKALAWVGLALLFAALPFITLIRVSVFLFHRFQVPGWVALGGGAATTVALLAVYLVLLSLRLGRKGRVPQILLKGSGALVAAYCLYGLVYLSGANAKTEEIRATYTALSPILRVSVSTLLLVDREGVLTATGRSLADYDSWGLPANERSLHLPQADGHVYAVDIRTLGRPEWRNRCVALYFRFMGLETLRHVGTADHLHVSLEPNRSSGG